MSAPKPRCDSDTLSLHGVDGTPERERPEKYSIGNLEVFRLVIGSSDVHGDVGMQWEGTVKYE